MTEVQLASLVQLAGLCLLCSAFLAGVMVCLFVLAVDIKLK